MKVKSAKILKVKSAKILGVKSEAIMKVKSAKLLKVKSAKILGVKSARIKKVKSTKPREDQIWGKVNLAKNGGGGENREIKIFWKIGNEDLAQRSKSAAVTIG